MKAGTYFVEAVRQQLGGTVFRRHRIPIPADKRVIHTLAVRGFRNIWYAGPFSDQAASQINGPEDVDEKFRTYL